MKKEEDISISNKLQPGGQQLYDSIFREDSDTDPENRSVRESANLNTQIAIPFNYDVKDSSSINLPAPIPTTNEFPSEKESPKSNFSKLGSDAPEPGDEGALG